MKTVQYFSVEYLEQSSKMKPEQIIRYLEDFRNMYYQAKPQRTKLISIKIPENMLALFREKSRLHGIKYQTQIKILMDNWLKN
jgi:predicted DNA binding CopG/RHH family protein